MTDAARGEQPDTEEGTDEPFLRVPFSADESGRAGRPRKRLAKLIAAKLALDLLLVCGLAVYTYAVTYRTAFEGELEHADAFGVSGWVGGLEGEVAPLELQLFLDGHFVASAVAGEPSQGGRRAFLFRFEQPRYGKHEARVYAVRESRAGARRTLQQVGGPLELK
ncbi:MAG: hypothetical protein JOZ96_16945 [Acidobacteria bacterium]|nr:hypothetical protein [Acidobacteriota bacterium]